MDQNRNQPQRFSVEQAKALAQSEAGKQLYAALQKKHSQQLNNAMEQAAAGDYSQMKKSLSEMLSSPEIQAMLAQLGGNFDG